MPKKLREELSEDPFYKLCARRDEECDGRITWEHSMYFKGRQIQEKWAIIPLCWYHHLGKGLDKRRNEWIALSRATEEDLDRYYKTDFKQKKKYLVETYGTFD